MHVCAFSSSSRNRSDALLSQFVRTVGAGNSILEYNQEQMRCQNYVSGESLIRSFPSKVDVSFFETRYCSRSR